MRNEPYRHGAPDAQSRYCKTGYSRRGVIAGGAGAAIAGTAWAAEDGAADLPGVILEPGPSDWWDARMLAAPRVIREPDGRWRMWYYGRDPDFPIDLPIPTGRIGLAESDDGIAWRRVRGPGHRGAVIDPAADPDRFDSGHVGVGSVIRTTDGYVMSYFGGPRQALEGAIGNGFPLRPNFARSRDGLTWVKDNGPYRGALIDVGLPGDFDAFYVGWPALLAEPDGSFKLYYHTLNRATGFTIGLAVSEDGSRWDKVGPVLGASGEAGSFDEKGCATRHVIRRDGQYHMLYEAADASDAFSIGYAVSDDGIAWRRVRGPQKGGAVMARGPAGSGRWDAGSVGTPWVVDAGDGSWRLYYLGRNEVERPPPGSGRGFGLNDLPFYTKIAMAVSDSGDFTDWRHWNR